MPAADSTSRAILRNVLIVVAVVLALYLIYLLRRPLTWLVIATFIAIAVSGPVNFLSRWMKRSFAIAAVYLALILIPAGIGALVIPGIVNQAEDLANNAPQYAHDVEDFVNKNQTLSDLNDKYDITGKLQDEANQLPDKIPDAAALLADIGVGIVNSVFAAITIFILSIFMVAGGRRWIAWFLTTRHPDHAQRIEKALDDIGQAVGAYFRGALLQALIAGVSAFIVLTILGVPFAAPLAVVVFFFDLIPVVGATLAAVLVALVTLFVDFPVATIVWVVFAIVYQQVENYVIQPQIQRRAVEIEPFTVLVAVLFGATLFGIFGALLAIPAAAAIQIAVREWWAYRKDIAAGTAPEGAPAQHEGRARPA